MKYGAFIIENRQIEGLEQIILEHERWLPEEWPVYYINDENISSTADYNRLLTSKRFWRTMPDKVLIFQHDSMLLRKGIEKFLEWDFVGAPIKAIQGCMNGGLSLRSRDVMMQIIKEFPYRGEAEDGNEDVYFCNRLVKVGAKIPPIEVAKQFSVETIFGLGSLGYHAIDKYLTVSQCQAIRNQYQVQVA